MATQRLPTLLRLQPLRLLCSRAMSGGQYGDGAGKGGGGGGSVREAGGAFGKMEAAHEEQYFRKLQAEQMEALKHMTKEDIAHHEKQIAHHKQQEQLEKMRDLLEDEVEHHERQIRQHEQAQQFERMREHLEEEVHHHELQIRHHEEAIAHHKKKMERLQKKTGSDSD